MPKSRRDLATRTRRHSPPAPRLLVAQGRGGLHESTVRLAGRFLSTRSKHAARPSASGSRRAGARLRRHHLAVGVHRDVSVDGHDLAQLGVIRSIIWPRQARIFIDSKQLVGSARPARWPARPGSGLPAPQSALSGSRSAGCRRRWKSPDHSVGISIEGGSGRRPAWPWPARGRAAPCPRRRADVLQHGERLTQQQRRAPCRCRGIAPGADGLFSRRRRSARPASL